MAVVDKEKCVSCGSCVGCCPFEAISFADDGKAFVDQEKCQHCGACIDSCPVNAISE